VLAAGDVTDPVHEVLALFVTFVSRRSIARSFFFLEASGECLTDSLPMMLQPVFECFKKARFEFGPESLNVCFLRLGRKPHRKLFN
jgi:hypothetical protein